MTLRTLIAAADLQALLAAAERGATPRPVLLDCGFDLVDPTAGARAFAEGHLPGARHANLDRDLSGPKRPGAGRHPLPERSAFAETAGAWGIAPGVPVVCYDAQGGFYAARAWWMLRWLGHAEVAVLDGGRAAWQAAGGALVAGSDDPQAPPPRPPYPLAAEPGMPRIAADALLQALGRVRIVDARPSDRFRGENETLDPVGGHIPGATNRCFRDNLAADGRFKSAEALRAEFDRWGGTPAGIVHSCGSGVTACHNLLAMEHAGLPGSTLYAGSWSEWSADPARPVARG